MKTQWWLSTDMIGKSGSPKEAGPFSTQMDANNARVALEKRGANLSIFEEHPPPVRIPALAVDLLRRAIVDDDREPSYEVGSSILREAIEQALAAVDAANGDAS